ncbi:hypothetical protein J7394_00015 [Ruegeria sp. R13_0]|uniref:hypothetical protein n=1 Tax=Ruegeria sp. R13_0 TaxID=2821099 RepID=UPI001ADB22E9|nr:hypothetical protein [Ruegeria sp. R13_0]MBO9432568.1 hypothetical protein [Ruegeria sp. R13_0]
MAVHTGSEFKSERPPAGTLWVTGWHCLKSKLGTSEYLVESEGAEPRSILIGKNKKRILEALIDGPMYCASPCRLSHYIMLLRDDHGINIETEWFSNDPRTGRERFGIYVLKDKVTRIDRQEVRS